MIRSVLVEVRRAVDTRAPRWAFGIAVAVGILLGFVVPGDAPRTFTESLAGLSLPLPVLMAILAVMAFTSDWSTRAALMTFALTPQRWRVLVARHLAVLILALATLLVIFVLAAVLFAVASPEEAGAVVDAEAFRTLASMSATTVAASLTAMAVAGLVLRTALALLITVLGPLIVILGLAFSPELIDWLNPYGFAAWLSAPTAAWAVHSDTAVGLGPAASSFLVWTAGPLVLGWCRQLRTEPR